jgi:predicted nucleotidyltransferase
MMSKDEIASVIAAYFVDKPVVRAYLFGSVARGDADEKSDVDVLVELDYANGGADFGNYLKMIDDLAIRLGRKVDLVSANGLSKFIAPFVDRDKQLVYERQIH